MEEKKKGLTKWIYWFTLGIAIIVVYKLLDNFTQIGDWFSRLLGVLMPFVVGILIAYLFYIPCRKVECLYRKVKKPKFISKRARGLSIITIYIIAILLIVIALNVVIPNVISSVAEFVDNFSTYYNNTMDKLEELPDDSILKSDVVMEFAESIKNIDLKPYLNMDNLMEYAKGAINIVTGIFDVFVAFVVSVYLLAGRRQILNFFKRLSHAIFKENTYNMISKYFNKANDIFFSFIGGQMLDAIVVGVITSIAMSIIGVKYSVLLGFMIGLFNLIPYFGAIVAVIIAVIVTIFTGGLWQAVIMAVVVIILQQIDANIINPRIISNSLSISPLLVIFAVTIGGAYFGVLGMFLAVPVFTVLKLLIEDYIDYRNNKEPEA